MTCKGLLKWIEMKNKIEKIEIKEKLGYFKVWEDWEK